jgi:hypothetical protein
VDGFFFTAIDHAYPDFFRAPVAVSCLYFRGDRYVYKTKISF